MNNKLAPFDWRALTQNVGIGPVFRPVIGVDEVGRGCLAGRVYAAAVILECETDVEHYTDSKAISESRREFLAESIHKHHRVGIGYATPREIDEINILRASFLAMKRAIAQLNVSDGHVLVDGNQRIPGLSRSFQQTTLIKGDMRATPISAASIVAKVTRDRLMKELAVVHPGYGFEIHKGYPTVEHKTAIRNLGPCLEHRRTFNGVRETIEQFTLFP